VLGTVRSFPRVQVPGLPRPPSGGPYRCFWMKNCQMVSVALSAVDGGGRLPIRCATDLGNAPGHWWPAPATVIRVIIAKSFPPGCELTKSSPLVDSGGMSSELLEFAARAQR
jgi:hypothetical protein